MVAQSISRLCHSRCRRRITPAATNPQNTTTPSRFITRKTVFGKKGGTMWLWTANKVAAAPMTTITIASAAPTQPRRRCSRIEPRTMSAGCATNSSTQRVKIAPWTCSSNGNEGESRKYPSRPFKLAGAAASHRFRAVDVCIVTALAEIVGCYLPYLWLRKGRPAWLAIPAAATLALFAWLLTLHPAGAGRIYAEYGGVYIGVAIRLAVGCRRHQAGDNGLDWRGRQSRRHGHHHVRPASSELKE